MSIQEITEADTRMLSFVRHSRLVALPQRRADLRRNLWNAFLDGVEYLSACTDEAQGAVPPVIAPPEIDWNLLDVRTSYPVPSVAVWQSGIITVSRDHREVGDTTDGDTVVRIIRRPEK